MIKPIDYPVAARALERGDYDNEDLLKLFDEADIAMAEQGCDRELGLDLEHLTQCWVEAEIQKHLKTDAP